MGTARSVFFTVSSVIMIISGIAGFVVLAFMANERISSHSYSMALLVICCGLIVVYSVLNIISGINGLRYSNKRSNSAVIIRIPQIAVIFCLISIILSVINGVNALHMAIIISSGIIIPDVFMYAAVKKSYT